MNNQDLFETNGYVVIPHFWAPEVCDKLRERASFIAENATSNSTFSTTERSHDNDPEFLASAERIHVFWEPKGDRTKGLDAVNKIAHTLHRDDPVFRKASQSRAITNLLASIGYGSPILIQSMFIPKSPIIGGLVRPHQDATFIRSAPKSCVALWFALQDTNQTNGALWVCPGSHKGPLRQLYHRRGDELELETCDEMPYPENRLTICVKKGSVIAFDGRCVHGSNANKSTNSRHAYTLHAVCKNATYHENNWIPFPKEVK